MNVEVVVHIFRTNVGDASERESLRALFEEEREVVEWSVDLEDCDRVLRIVSTKPSALDYMIKIKQKGFLCEELQ